MDLDRVDNLNPSLLLRPYGQAERALGALAHTLRTTPLHATWLWREITRSAVTIAQASGYHAKIDQLRAALIGTPIEREDSTPGLAAARRVFLAAAPIFRKGQKADSENCLWPQFWHDEARNDGTHGLSDSSVLADGDAPNGDGVSRPGGVVGDMDRAGEAALERDRLLALVRELAGFADDGRRPALINLLVDLRKHAATRHLPPQLVRIAMPLALREAGLVPKAAPGLLGGRRLPLGLSRAGASEKPLNDWLKQALEALAAEADQSYRRLFELTRQHQAWHGALARERLRKHALAPKALDLLAATPVLSIGLVASHLGCSHVAAGKVIARLVDLGILIEQTSRSRHKLFIAGDLPADSRGEAGQDGALTLSEPQRSVDTDAIEATLDGLFADLDRVTERARERVAESKG